MTWPVDDIDTLDRALALGASGIITHDEDVLRAVRRRASGQGPASVSPR